MPEFEGIFTPEGTLSECSHELARWYAQTFAVDHFGTAIDLVRLKGQTLSQYLWHIIAQTFHARSTAGDPLRFWVPILLVTMPAKANSDFLAYMISHCAFLDDRHTMLQLFRKLTAPVLQLRRRFSPKDDEKSTVPDAPTVS